jgi:uncharacterized RDD family membrane protein YckC
MTIEQRDTMNNETPIDPSVPEMLENRQEPSDSAEVFRPTLTQLALGSALIIGDSVGNRLEITPPPESIPVRNLESVLRPVAEWEPAETAFDQARYIAIGLTKETRQTAGRSGRGLYQTTDSLGKSIERTTRPIRRSRLLRPIRTRFLRYQSQGEATVNRWADIGRSEESRSRAIAEASLSSLMQRSVTDLTESEHVQVLVQQVVTSQGTSIIEEIIEEIRERVVTLDILLARRTRRSRGGTSRVIDSPDFRQVYLQNRPTFTHIPQVGRTLAGHYAGSVSRLLGFLVDVVILALALSFTTTFINAFINLFNLRGFFDNLVTSNDFAGVLLAASAGFASFIFVSGYGVLSWSLSGQTLGDLIFGVRVVRSDGSRISFSRSLLRIVGAYLAGIPFFLGFLWAIWDNRYQGWHDKIAGTVVVYDWPAVPDEIFLRDELDVIGVLPRQQRQR